MRQTGHKPVYSEDSIQGNRLSATLTASGRYSDRISPLTRCHAIEYLMLSVQILTINSSKPHMGVYSHNPDVSDGRITYLRTAVVLIAHNVAKITLIT